MNNPPKEVKTVMEAVCILNFIDPPKKPNPTTLKMEPDWWAASVRFLGDTKFLEKLLDYDRENIPEKTIKSLKKYIDDPDFSPERMEKISLACQGLCK